MGGVEAVEKPTFAASPTSPIELAIDRVGQERNLRVGRLARRRFIERALSALLADLLPVSVMSELLDVVYQAEQLPLPIDFVPAA